MNKRLATAYDRLIYDRKKCFLVGERKNKKWLCLKCPVAYDTPGPLLKHLRLIHKRNENETNADREKVIHE